MSDTPSALLATFVAGLLAVAILLVAFGAAVVIYQRRYLGMQRSYAQRLLQAQEEERAWVAREVHDDALQRIAMIHQQIESFTGSAPPITGQQALRMGALEEEMKDLAGVLRGLAHRLHPSQIEKAGLAAALQGLCRDVAEGHGIRVDTRIEATRAPAEPARAVAVYRIAQEALRNIASHAATPVATLEFRMDGDVALLTVTDQGRGFDPGASATGLGLTSMRERAHLAGGTVSITSHIGQGTSVRAAIPLGGERD